MAHNLIFLLSLPRAGLGPVHPGGDPAGAELPLPGEVLVRPLLHLHPHRGTERRRAASRHHLPGHGGRGGIQGRRTQGIHRGLQMGLLLLLLRLLLILKFPWIFSLTDQRFRLQPP